MRGYHFVPSILIKRWVRMCLAVIMAFVALNVVAYRHAWRMTHFSNAATRTSSPEKLSAFGKLSVLVTGVTLPRPELSAISVEHRVVTFHTADGIQLEAWDIPVAEPRGVALMFHGYAVSKSAMLGEAEVFRGLGLRTVLVDLRGSGGSDGDVTTLGWCESADVAAAVSWARGEWPEQPLILYGQSLGAAAILRAMAVDGMRADGIILECPYDRLLTTVGNRYHAMHLPAFPFAQLLVFWGGVQHGFNAFRLNPVDYAASVTCPALVIGGERDLWALPDEVRRVADALGGTTQCHIFEHTGHGGYGQNEGGIYRDIMSKWLDALLSSLGPTDS
jgi:hypothetical protein